MIADFRGHDMARRASQRSYYRVPNLSRTGSGLEGAMCARQILIWRGRSLERRIFTLRAGFGVFGSDRSKVQILNKTRRDDPWRRSNDSRMLTVVYHDSNTQKES